MSGLPKTSSTAVDAKTSRPRRTLLEAWHFCAAGLANQYQSTTHKPDMLVLIYVVRLLFANSSRAEGARDGGWDTRRRRRIQMAPTRTRSTWQGTAYTASHRRG